MELKEEVHNMGLALVWRKQQECNLREILKTVKDGHDIERQNILAKMSEKNSLTLHREMNFSWGKWLQIEWCSRKERSGIVWLLAGVWLLKGISPLCLGQEDVKHILLDCLETRN
jgi:hypothetical protein